MSTFLTNNSPDLYALTSCIVLRKNNLFLARLSGISATWMKVIDVITSRLLLIFLENIWKYYLYLLPFTLGWAASSAEAVHQLCGPVRNPDITKG